MNEEFRYELWLMNDGPAKAEAKHKELATAAKQDFPNAGWTVVYEGMAYHGDTREFQVMELVVRKGMTVRIVRWHSGNKGWFEADGKHGNGIFRP